MKTYLIQETQVIKQFREVYGLDNDTISRIIQNHGPEIRESIQLGYDPVAVANEFQAQWAGR